MLIQVYADPAKGMTDAISAYTNATNAATIAATRKDKLTEGPV